MIILCELNGGNRRLGCMMTAIFQILPKKITLKHKRNMVNNCGGGGGEGGRAPAMGFRNFNLRSSQVRNIAKILFNVGFSFFLVFQPPK